MNRHPLDVFSLLSGLVLCGIATAALFGVGAGVAPWIWPSVLVGSGVAVLAVVLGSTRGSADGAAVTVDDPLTVAARAEVDAVDVTTPLPGGGGDDATD